MIENITKTILNQQSNGIVLLTVNKEIIFANESAKNFFKGKRQEDLGEFLECDTEILKERICKNKENCENCFLGIAFEKVLKSKKVLVENIKFFKNDYEINISCKLSYDPDSNIVTVEFLDIENKYTELQFLLKAFEKSRDIIFFKNSKLQYIYINEAGKNFFQGMDILYKTDADLMPLEIAKQCETGDLETLKKGQFHILEFLGDRVFRTSKEFINGGILAIAQDISEEYFAQILSNTDGLTGLYNRKKFDELYSSVFLTKDSSIYLGVIDLDNLREINNTFGHLKGDEYLKTLSSTLKKYENVTFFRIGGDEFTFLMDGSKKEVINLFKKIYSDLIKANKELNINLSISTGVKKINLKKSKDENFEDVDKLLYDIKKEGKGRFKIG